MNASDREQLDEALHGQIVALCAQGDACADKRQYDRALDRYRAALDLLPAPIEQWAAATWILGAIGDAAFSNADYEQAQAALQWAMRCPDAIGNPFLHLRLGQTQFELGNTARATDEFARAYMGAGSDIFNNEDPKYITLIRHVLRDTN